MQENLSRPRVAPGCKPATRILAEYCGDPEGPTLVVLLAVHGNETGSVIAAQRIIDRLERLELTLYGRLVLLVGNLEALRRGVRYVDHDLNRIWHDAAPHHCDGQPLIEYLEMRELELILDDLATSSNGPMTVIDLHSFSGKGSPFLIAPDQGCPDELIADMPFPVIRGLNSFLTGTLCGWLEARGHRTLILEGGRESDPEVPINMAAFLWQVFARMRLMDASKVPTFAKQTWALLTEEITRLPLSLQTRYRHRIETGEAFRMEPGFRTFDQIQEGQLLAQNRHGEIHAPFTGFLLMPLYQGQGEDGFFLAESTRVAATTAS